MPLFDTHTHTNHSHDSQCPLDDLCEIAYRQGLGGITITDHADIEYFRTSNVRQRVRESFLDADAHRYAWAGKLKVMRGVEIGEGIWDPDAVRTLLTDSPFDEIIGSVHAVRLEGYSNPYAKIDFGAMPPAVRHAFLAQYFADMTEMVETADMDILAHVTCPLRYMVGKFGLTVDMTPYLTAVDKVLRTAVERDLALEINTSCIGTAYDELLPYEGIIGTYYKLGGRKFTFGSDCHQAARCGVGFDRAVRTLTRLGVTQAVYYEQRTAVPYSIV